MQKQEIISLIQSLGFQNETSKDIFVREYKKHSYTISVDIQKGEISYPAPIQIGDKTTTNFAHPENFVVLECVDRLLKIGLIGTISDELDGKSLTEKAAKLVIKDKNRLSTKYLSYCLRTGHAQKQISNRTRALGVPKLALDRIKSIQIPLPPIESQHKIVADLDEKEQRIAELKSKISEAESKKAAILDKYLR